MKKIEFIPADEQVEKYVTPPLPSKKYIPKWYKDSLMYYNSNKIEIEMKDKKPVVNKTMKHCIPIIDAMTSGYIQESWTDIYIEQKDYEIRYFWAADPEIMGSRNQIAKQKIPTPIGCSETMFDWKLKWVPKTPLGYSCLFVHPMYHYDLPFITIPGIIDSDKFNRPGTAPSFFIKKDFIGIIPKGTPMYQILLFKKENWKSQNVEFNKYKKMLEEQNFKIHSKFHSTYKKIFWNRVNYK
jgi:hypothetical protein